MYKRLMLAIAFMVTVGFSQARQIAPVDAAIYEGVEINMPKVQLPSFPSYSVSIADYGAKADGKTKNSEAFAKAIEHVAEKGGGKVIVPRGIWLTGPITLKSNIHLYLEDGALVLFSKDFDDYPLVKTSFEGLNTVRCISPINALEAENIAITGAGVIDGNGDAWRPVKRGKMTDNQWSKLVKSGGVLSDDEKMWFPTASAKRGYVSSSNFNVPDLIGEDELSSVKDFLRPVMVSLVKCNKVLLDGPTFQNSPAWNIHPLMSENMVIRNLKVRNPWYSQNGDGLDLESCKNVLIYNNTFDVGDDAICIKSGKDKDGRDRGMPTENVIVKNNTVYHAHGGFVVGSEMSGGVRNVHVSECTFIGTDVGLRFKSTRGRGGVVEDIYISNINMINIPTDAIRFNMFYGGNSPVLEEDQNAEDEARDEALVPVTEETPAFRNIYMKNITATGSGTAAFFMGLPEKSLENVRLENALLEAKNGITVIDTDGLELKNVKVIAEKTPALTIYNSKNVDVSGFSFVDNGMVPVKVLGRLSGNIHFDKGDFTALKDQLISGKELPVNAIKIK
ncbi:glycoside hydrolase family 28 protein [Echinicola sediminis]